MHLPSACRFHVGTRRNFGCFKEVRSHQGRTSCGSANTPQVVLTREKGKNGPLARLLDQKGISWLEMPLIESADGPDRHQLAIALREQKYDWIVVTSPEAAAVFLEGWREAEQPKVQIAVVGEGSGRIIEAANLPDCLQINFAPSKANAAHLSAELPLPDSSGCLVLYPSSAKAGSDLQSGLEQRGCSVVRLNTYDTLPVSAVDDSLLASARQAEVVAIASPSAVKAWVKFAGLQDQTDIAIACIGSTSARAAEKLGLKRIYHPDNPGLEGFIMAIEDALKASQTLSLA